MSRISRIKIPILIIIFSLFVFNVAAYSVQAVDSYSYQFIENWSYQANKGDYLQDVRFDEDGQIFLSNGGDAVSYIIALDADGDFLWDYYLRDRKYDHFFITEDYIYLTSTYSEKNQILLLDKDSGRKIKEVSLELEADEWINEITVDDDGHIFATTDNRFIIFEEDGDRDWDLEIEIPYGFKPVIGSNGIIYIMGFIEEEKEYELYAVKSSGSVNWSESLNFSGYTFTSEDNEYPILFDEDGTLYIKDEYTVYSIDPKDGDVNWKYSLDEEERDDFQFLLEPDEDDLEDMNTARSPYLVNRVGDTVLLFSKYEMIALDADDGDEEWYFDRGRFPLSKLVEVNDTYYALFDRLYAIDEDGDLDWSYDTGNDGSYNNLNFQVDHDDNIYLYQYQYSSSPGTLYLLNKEGDLQWKSTSFPSGRHEWYMTENGPVFQTQQYQNGNYESELYLISPNRSISNVKLDGITVKLFEKDDMLYILTNSGLYTFKYQLTFADMDDNLPEENQAETAEGSEGCYTYINTDDVTNLNGYKLNVQWDYEIDKNSDDFEVYTDQDGNAYLAMRDGHDLSYLYSFKSNGTLKWKHSLTGDEVSGVAVSEDYIHLYDNTYDHNEFILLDKDTGKEEKKFSINFLNDDVNDIVFDPEGNIYISTEEELTKYSAYGRKSWDWEMEIPSSLKTVIGPDGAIYAFDYIDNKKYELYAFSSNGKKRWSETLTFENFALAKSEQPILFDQDGTLYILNDKDHTLYSIDPEDGDIHFKHTGDVSIQLLLKPARNDNLSQIVTRSSRQVIKLDERIILYSSNEVYALNSESGKVVWRFGKQYPLKDINEQNDTIYIIFDDLYALSTNGNVLWKYSLKDNSYSNENLMMNEYGTVYVSESLSGNREGLIHALDTNGQLQWEYKNSIFLNEKWFLAEETPIYPLYRSSLNETELYNVNQSVAISKKNIDGKFIGIVETDQLIYVLTDEQLVALSYSYGSAISSNVKCSGNTSNNPNSPLVENSSGIQLYINGIKQNFSQNVLLSDGRALVPVAQIFEQLGGTVTWDENTSSVTIKTNSNTIILRNQSKTATVNGQNISLDVESQISNGIFLVPLRFIGETLGAEVIWDYAAEIIYINTK